MTLTDRNQADYLKRYEADDDGLRFQPLLYQGNYDGMDPIPDGILGDKIIRSRMKSKVLEKVSHADVLNDQFTLDELNTLIPGGLPPSAFLYEAWWNNDDRSHHHCRAWGDAGYRTQVDLSRKQVRFVPR